MTEPPLEILHRTEDLVIIAKPPGRLVHRTDVSWARETFLVQALSEQLGAYVRPVHRLDRNTSGVLVFALTREAAREAQAALAAPEAEKRYLVLARGVPPEHFAADRPLRDDRGDPAPCRTDFERLAAFPAAGVSLLAARLYSGRRHQIRRHLNHAGHHVIGDTTHGKGPINRRLRTEHGLPRMFLHAARLVFQRPGQAAVSVEAALPADLRSVLRSVAATAEADPVPPGLMGPG